MRKSHKRITIIIFFIFQIFLLRYSVFKYSEETEKIFSSYFPTNNELSFTEYIFDHSGDLIDEIKREKDSYDVLCNYYYQQTDIRNEYTQNGLVADEVLPKKIDLYEKFNTTLNSKYNCVIDMQTKRIIYGNNAYEKAPNASTTKILTCIVALENGNLNDVVTVSKYAASMPEVSLKMAAGETFYLKDLLFSLMLESHNDTAVAIAEHISSSVEDFADLMNEKAVEIGCKNTNFVTPNGLDAQNHYTCAYDLCLMGAYALENDTFREIISTPSKTITSLNENKTYSLSNKDKFLTMYSGALGIKTGFTNKAGYCFVGAAKYNDRIFISSVLACGWPPSKNLKWTDTTRLIDYAKNNTKTLPALSDDLITNTVKNSILDIRIYNCINEFDVKESILQSLDYTFSSSEIVTQNEKSYLHLLVPDKIYLPCNDDSILGFIIYEDNNYIYKVEPIIVKEEFITPDIKDIMYSIAGLYL